MQKARGQALPGASPGIALPLLVGIRFQVLFHSPHRGAFHLSLTVLVHYRSPEEYLALRDGPRRFPRDFSCPAVLRNLSSEPACFRLRGCHPLWPTVPDRSTSLLVGNSPALRPDRPYNPTVQARWFGLFRVRSPLLAESLLFSVPAGTEMVHFPTLPSTAYVFSQGYPGISQSGFPHSEIPGSKPVCGSPRLIAAYHVLHRLWRQGIHRTPLVA